MAPSRQNIVVLDGYTLNPGDLSWNKIKALGYSIIYEYTPPEEIFERSKRANIILTNKAVLDATTIAQLPELKCICVTATGYNNVDLEAANSRKIPVCNTVGYGTDSVAQHVFALLLELANNVGRHSSSVHQGEWNHQRDFTYHLSPIQELADKTLGIYGFGKIGQKVAEIGMAFGMNIIANHKHPERDARPGVRFVTLEELLEESDVISLHAPLTASNEGIINQDNLQKMKSTAYLINTGRGGLINERDLLHALESDLIAGAGLDVLSQEPPKNGNILLGAKNCLITPHLAWASREARQRLMDITVDNIRLFLANRPQNVVNLP